MSAVNVHGRIYPVIYDPAVRYVNRRPYLGHIDHSQQTITICAAAPASLRPALERYAADLARRSAPANQPPAWCWVSGCYLLRVRPPAKAPRPR